MIRKIRTREETDKKNRNLQIIVGVVLVGVLVLSIVGFGFMNNDGEESDWSEEYNGFEFSRVQGGWGLVVEEQVFYFQYLPQEVENVSVSGNFNIQSYLNRPLYFVGDGASSEILNNLGRYVLRYQEACMEGLNCSEELPVKTCEDNLIIFESGEDKVYQDVNCVYISGEFVKGADAFLYHLLGVR